MSPDIFFILNIFVLLFYRMNVKNIILNIYEYFGFCLCEDKDSKPYVWIARI